MIGIAHRIKMEPWDFYIVVPWEMQGLLCICEVFTGDNDWEGVGKGKAGNQRASVSILVDACTAGFSHCCCNQHRWAKYVGIQNSLAYFLCYHSCTGKTLAWVMPELLVASVNWWRLLVLVTIHRLHCLLWPLMLPDSMMPP